MSTQAPNQIESANWEIIGDPRLSDAAIDALAELALDLVEGEEAAETAKNERTKQEK